MSRIKHHTSNALKEYLVEHFSDKRFFVHDLHAFANIRGIPVKTLTYSCWWLCNRGDIVKCGERKRPDGGPLNIYKLAEKQSENIEHVDMQTAAANLARVLCTLD